MWLIEGEWTKVTAQQKVLILSSAAGGGHRAASQALIDLLGERYNVEVVNGFEVILAPLDVIRLISGGRWSVEEAYNTLLRGGWHRTINTVVKRAIRPLLSASQRWFQRLLRDYFVQTSPDLVISVVPFINWPASDAAHELSIPFLMVAIDGDVANYVGRLDRLTHQDVHLTVMRDHPILDNQLDRLGLESRLTVHRVGMPLRRQYFVTPDREALRRKYGVPPGKFVVLLMMGAVGGQSVYRFARTVLTLPHDIHLIVCVGSNTALTGMLEAVERAPQVSMTIQGYTDHIEELMAIADVLLTKPGPGTIQEATKMELPMLLDNTRRPLYWERANIEWVRHHGIGQTVDDHRDLPQLINIYKTDVGLRLRQRSALRRLSSRIKQSELGRVVDDMVTRPPSADVKTE